MSPINWLNNLLFLENLLGVYRNYCIQKNIKKCFILFQMLIQMLIHAKVLFESIHLLLGGDYQTNIIYTCFSTSLYMMFLSFMVSGFCYSRAFMSYLGKIKRISECFKHNTQEFDSLKKTFWFGIFFNFVFLVYAILICSTTLIRILPSNLLLTVIIMASQITIRMAMMFHQLMMYFVIMTIVHLFKCLNSLISTNHERVTDIRSNDRCYMMREQFQGWVEQYQELKSCCEKITICFGGQFFFYIMVSISHYILMTYYVFHVNDVHTGNIFEGTNVAIGLISYWAVMMLPLAAGQMVRNQGVKFHRVLVRLYNKMIDGSGDAEAKLIKDYIHLIKRNPLEIRLLSKLPAGMYMLPVILTLAVNYLIVMLQFNHII